MSDSFERAPSNLQNKIAALVLLILIVAGVVATQFDFWAFDQFHWFGDLAAHAGERFGPKGRVAINFPAGLGTWIIREAGTAPTAGTPTPRVSPPPSGSGTAPGVTATPTVPAGAGAAPIDYKAESKAKLGLAQDAWNSGEIEGENGAWALAGAAIGADPENYEATTLKKKCEDVIAALRVLDGTPDDQPAAVIRAAKKVLETVPNIQRPTGPSPSERKVAAEMRLRWQQEHAALKTWAAGFWPDKTKPLDTAEALKYLTGRDLVSKSTTAKPIVGRPGDLFVIEVLWPYPELAPIEVTVNRAFLDQNASTAVAIGTKFTVGTGVRWVPTPAPTATPMPTATSTPTPTATTTPTPTPIPLTIEIYPVDADGKFQTYAPVTMYIRGTGPAGADVEVYRTDSTGSTYLVTTVTANASGRWEFQASTNVWGLFQAKSGGGAESEIWDHHQSGRP